MKCSELWLREWVNPKRTRVELCHDLTMGGLEVESLSPVDFPSEEESQGILALAEDYTIDISITPNRGDCLSVKGIAREVSALTGTPWQNLSITETQSIIKDILPLTVEVKEGCPNYVGRVIRNLKADVATPSWLQLKERLRRSGVRSISPIVDVTNYVMLELGQPMHAFDLNTINKGIIVRQSKKGEKITLLDGSDKELDAETLVIADHEKPLAIAGVMGGLDSSVTLLTRDIFLESAYFSPATIARQRQYYGLNSDSAYRFERGVDPTIQREAIERATQLIIDIVGGEPGPVIEETNKNFPKAEVVIQLKPLKIEQVIGIKIPKEKVESIFDSLKFKWEWKDASYRIYVPRYRFDIFLPEDVIEEIARLYGYDKIPTHYIKAELSPSHAGETEQDLHDLRQAFSDQGFHEIISYSFIDKKLQALLDPQEFPRELLNPITAEMAVMRTNLWPGLVNTLLNNKSRQQHRVRLFEIGTCFITRADTILQQPRIGGLITGLAYPEQWGMPSREADFYDLKGDIENILNLLPTDQNFIFKPESHPGLHPGQSAGIYHQDRKLGILGALDPTLQQTLDLSHKVYLFELDLTMLLKGGSPRFREISKFPEIRRDIAILVNQAIPAKGIQDTIKMIAGDWLKDVFIFDVYQGKGISPGLKSIALALILQHPTRTLIDDEVAELMERVITALKGQLGAELRS
jgi:phenylalanyl-tRNA synthetase beta chain